MYKLTGLDVSFYHRGLFISHSQPKNTSNCSEHPQLYLYSSHYPIIHYHTTKTTPSSLYPNFEAYFHHPSPASRLKKKKTLGNRGSLHLPLFCRPSDGNVSQLMTITFGPTTCSVVSRVEARGKAVHVQSVPARVLARVLSSAGAAALIHTPSSPLN